MSSSNPGEKGGAEPLPSFIGFEARAKAVGIAGLDDAIKRSAYPENTLSIEDLGMVTLVAAIPYARILCGEENNGPGAAVAYNGWYFAAIVGGYLIGNAGAPKPPPYPGVFYELEGVPDERQKILTVQAAYLKDRPTLKTWIDRYAPQLDTLGIYPEIAPAVATLTIRDIEEIERQKFIEAEVHLYGGDLGRESE